MNLLVSSWLFPSYTPLHAGRIWLSGLDTLLHRDWRWRLVNRHCLNGFWGLNAVECGWGINKDTSKCSLWNVNDMNVPCHICTCDHQHCRSHSVTISSLHVHWRREMRHFHCSGWNITRKQTLVGASLGLCLRASKQTQQIAPGQAAVPPRSQVFGSRGV